MSDDLEANYAAAYKNRIGFGKKPALLLIDFFQAYFDKSCPLYAGVDDALSSAIRVLDAARSANILVVFTRVVYHPSGINGGVFFKKAEPLKYLVEGSKLGAWTEDLAPLDSDLVISKQYPSAFFGTSLASTLTAAGVDSVLLTGLTTSGCIRASCVDACSHGFIPIVVEEACGDRHPDPHRANLFDMNAKYADVVKEREAIEYLATLS